MTDASLYGKLFFSLLLQKYNGKCPTETGNRKRRIKFMQNIVRVTAADCETQLERLLQYIYIMITWTLIVT